MANLIESAAAWVAGVRQIEKTDPVVGGPPNDATNEGITNIPLKQLADRTAWLKGEKERLEGLIGGGAKSLTNPGYSLMPGGLMLAWGSAALAAGGSTVSFLVPFPTTCFSVVAISLQGGGWIVTIGGSSITRSSFFAQCSDVGATQRATTISYIATGV